jgi:hypothetical protein
MQILRADLERARANLAEASDPRAKAALEGVVMTLEWAIEDGGRTPPSAVAAGLRVEAPPKAAKAPANADDALVAGNVAEIAGSIDADTDLDALEAAEKDREVPRSGVLNAIAKERAARAKAE